MFHQSIKLCPRMFEARLRTWWQNSILAFLLVLSWLGVLHSFFCDINRLIPILIRQQNWLRSIQKDFTCQFQKHTIKLIGRSFIMQQDRDPRTHWQDNKGVYQELKAVSSKLAMSVSKVQFTCWRGDWQLEEVASQAWKRRKQEFGDVSGSQVRCIHCLQRNLK